MARSFHPEDPLHGLRPGEHHSPKKKSRSLFSRIFSALFSMRLDKSGHRLYFAMVAFIIVFSTIGWKLVKLADQPDEVAAKLFQPEQITKARPDIVDRNGVVLATDLKSYSVYVEPRRLIDKDEAVELLTAVLPELNARDLRNKFSTKRGAVMIKRRVSQQVKDEIFRLGLPGIEFPTESQRYYPNGVAAAHVLGTTDVDNKGISGIEKYIDGQGLSDLANA
ncbi:MAG: penicillin-binding protein 2, partial [Alphaproteobacteria bacterium]|nr:penicillin-binding protein 2 [Alphaproteobacteria bacterium]